jgi:hypothetical protein
LIHYYANKVRQANEAFYGSLDNPNKIFRMKAADNVVAAMNDYVNSVQEHPEELHAQYEQQQLRD